MEALASNAANRDGAAAQVLENCKRLKYPRISVVPFAVEAHGRLGSAALEFVKLVAPQDPAARSAALVRLYQRVASLLQRMQADAINTATWPGRPTDMPGT